MAGRKTVKRTYRILIGAALILGILAGFVLFSYAGVQPVVDLEYAPGPLSPGVFTEKEAAFTSTWSGASLEKGEHVLFIKVSGRPFPVPVLLRVADTTAPEAQAAAPRIVPLGETLSPEQLIAQVRDNDIVQVYFETPADFVTVGQHTVRVAVEDLSGNRSAVTCAYEVRGVGDGCTIEAGAALPPWEEYLIADPAATGAELVSEYREGMAHHVGQYDLVFRFRVGGTVQQDVSHLTVVDTVAPTGRGLCVLSVPGQEITPASFVADARDETDISYTYVIPPDPAVHEVQDVAVRMTDEGGNTADIDAALIPSTVSPLTVEARREPLTGVDFGLVGDVEVEPFVPDTVGSALVKLWIDGREESAYVTVADTQPPAITLLDARDIYEDHPLPVEALFAAEDVSGVTLVYATEPDWTEPGEQIVTARATDGLGNVSERTATITILDDSRPPVIYGVTNRNVYVGESVAYLAGVSAQDDMDGAVPVTVETQVDILTEGRYTVTYRAADASGNEASATCTFIVIEPTVTEATVRELAQKVMAKITTEDMVDAEKLKAIYWYVRDHIHYGNGANHNYSDWRRAARDGFVNGKGDCYNIWAVTKALLDETDIEYISVERLKSARRTTRHYWVNVNLGTGWYIFDPTWTPLHKFTCFMWTKKQSDSCKLYWLYEYDKYPPLATEPFDYDAVVAAEKAGLLP